MHNQEDVEEMSGNHKEELKKVPEKSKESEKSKNYEKPEIFKFEEGLT